MLAADEIIFETERLTVRYFTEADADNYFALQSNPDVMQYIRKPRTREESDLFLTEKILAAPRSDYKGYWAVEIRNTREFIGCFVIIPLPDQIDETQLGYSFLPQYWGNGYATEVSRGGVEYFKNRTPLTKIFGITETPNFVSQKVLLKVGFRFFRSKMEEEKELQVYILEKLATNGH